MSSAYPECPRPSARWQGRHWGQADSRITPGERVCASTKFPRLTLQSGHPALVSVAVANKCGLLSSQKLPTRPWVRAQCCCKRGHTRPLSRSTSHSLEEAVLRNKEPRGARSPRDPKDGSHSPSTSSWEESQGHPSLPSRAPHPTARGQDSPRRQPADGPGSSVADWVLAHIQRGWEGQEGWSSEPLHLRNGLARHPQPSICSLAGSRGLGGQGGSSSSPAPPPPLLCTSSPSWTLPPPPTNSTSILDPRGCEPGRPFLTGHGALSSGLGRPLVESHKRVLGSEGAGRLTAAPGSGGGGWRGRRSQGTRRIKCNEGWRVQLAGSGVIWASTCLGR